MTSPFPIRPFLAGMHPYTPGEQPVGSGIVKLNTNENPYPPAPEVIEAIQAEAHKLRLYPNPTAEPLRRALGGYHGVDPARILVGNGSDEILRLLIHASIGPGDSIAVVHPTYSLYPVLAAFYGGATREYPMPDLETLPEALFDGPEPLLILPNPNPPVGTLYARTDIARLCRGRSHGLVVIDEAYVDFAPRDAVSLLGEFPNLVVTRTFSKSFSLAGMRVGYLLGHPDLVAQIHKIRDSYNVNRIAQAAAGAAIAAVAYMQANCDRIRQTREQTRSALEAIGYRIPDSHGNFLFALHPAAARHAALLRERGILVRYFDQPLLRGGMRISIGTPGQMEQLLEALRDIITA